MEMQTKGVNQDIRNELNMRSIRWKIKKRVLERIGHLKRGKQKSKRGDFRMAGRSGRCRQRKKKTVLYWKRLVKDAGSDLLKIGELMHKRKDWKSTVREGMKHLEKWERRRCKKDQTPEFQRNIQLGRETTFKGTFKGCSKLCKSKGGLTIHVKRIHNISELKCEDCKKILVKKQI